MTDQEKSLLSLLGAGLALIMALATCIVSSQIYQTRQPMPGTIPGIPSLEPVTRPTQGSLAVEYILDASGSMNETLLDGTRKADAARQLLSASLNTYRPETGLGLRVYGHRLPETPREPSCQDIELIAPLEPGYQGQMATWLQNGYQPQGMTPIATALQQAVTDFSVEPGRVNSIVLISDGQETCGGDPCQVVRDLETAGIRFSLHVIGLNVDDSTRAQLTCIAQAGGGVYQDANTSQELQTALEVVQQQVVQKDQTPEDGRLPTSTSNLLSKPTPEGTNLPSVGGNLVLNPSFDLGTTYSPDYWAWLPYTGACSKMVYNDPANAHTSPNFLATGLSDDYPECQSVYQDIPASVTSGDSYTMSVWLKSPWQPQTISFVLEWTGGISPIVTNQVVNLTDTWQCFQTILDIPDPGDNTKFRVLVNLPNNNLDVDIDDVLLLKGKYQSCPSGSGPPEIPATPQIGSELVSPSDGMNLVYVPEGEFSMGVENGLLGVTPQNVYLAAFWIDKTEVTNGMYAICVNAGTCQPPSDLSSSTRSSYFGNLQYTDYPVIYVSWNDAQSYCAWAGRRLPTEAEWEKAARGPDGRVYPWGNNEPTCSLANTNIDVQGNCVGDTRAAGSYPAGASPYAALDMTGNVSEWSVYEVGETVNAPPAPTTPGGPSGIFTAVRGGSWSTNEYTIRPIHRYKYTTTYAENDFGFRCALAP